MRSRRIRGKHVMEVRNGDVLDKITNLPDEILCHMLSYLPTRCAVATSILSIRWRYLFTLTNCLSFDDEPCFDDWENDEELEVSLKTRFKKFVYKVLELHKISPIEKFSLYFGGTYDKSDLNAWVSTAVKKGVQDLGYHVFVMEDHELPDDLFTCETLKRLKITSNCGKYVARTPMSAWLPSLKILQLCRVRFVDYNSVETLFSGCKLLEELTLLCCRCDTYYHVILSTALLKVLTIEEVSFCRGLFEVDAPNLEYLTYSLNTGVKIIPSWKCSFSLVKAKLKFDYAEHDSNKKSLQYDLELVKDAACKATELHLLHDSLQLLLKLPDHEEMPVFHNLSRLYLGHISYDAWKYVTSLIDKSPQLETVMFQSGLPRDHRDPLSSPSEPLPPFSCEAKVIEVDFFRGDEGSLLHLGHLLGNAQVLKKVILHKHRSCDTEKELQISNDLLMLPRASQDCCIELN